MRRRLTILLVAFLAGVPLSSASAAPIIETFGNIGSCAVQTSAASMTYNGSSIPASGPVFIGSPYQGQYGMVDCHITFDFSANQATVFNFPSTSYPSSFSFVQGALDYPVDLTITYTDNSTSGWTITDDKLVGHTKVDTFTATAGKIIKSFTVNAFQNTYDYWFLDSIVWSIGATSTTTTLADQANGRATYRTVDQLTATVSGGAGKVTFYAGGKRIPMCVNIPVSGSTATCQWRPSTHGTTSVYAVFKSSDSGYLSSTSTPVKVGVTQRATSR